MKILFNLGKILVLIRAIKKMVEEITKSEKSMPSQESVLDVVAGIQTLLASKVIDIPGVNEDEVVDSIEELKNVILKKVV